LCNDPFLQEDNDYREDHSSDQKVEVVIDRKFGVHFEVSVKTPVLLVENLAKHFDLRVIFQSEIGNPQKENYDNQ
jgi:hypothetical protein